MRQIKRLFDVARRGLFYGTLPYDRVLAAIEHLAVCIDDYDGDIDWHLGECSGCTLDSLLIGAYWFCTDYYGGMDSSEYHLLSALSSVFNPGHTSGPEPESSERDVYVALERLVR